MHIRKIVKARTDCATGRSIGKRDRIIRSGGRTWLLSLGLSLLWMSLIPTWAQSTFVPAVKPSPFALTNFTPAMLSNLAANPQAFRIEFQKVMTAEQRQVWEAARFSFEKRAEHEAAVEAQMTPAQIQQKKEEALAITDPKQYRALHPVSPALQLERQRALESFGKPSSVATNAAPSKAANTP